MVGSVRSNTQRSYYIICSHGAARVRRTSSCTCCRCTVRNIFHEKIEATQRKPKDPIESEAQKRQHKFHGQTPLFSCFRLPTREITALRGRARTAV